MAPDKVNYTEWDAPTVASPTKPTTLVPVKHDRKPTGIVLTTADQIDTTAVRWLWRGHLAAGKFQLLAGPAGIGKTTLCLAIAATISCGGTWPDGSKAEEGFVVVQAGEDDVKDTVVPRLKALGANLENVLVVEGYVENERIRPFDPATDCADLRAKVQQQAGVKLVLIDPVSVLVRGSSNDLLDVRRGLGWLTDLAAETGATVLGITHLSKASAGRDALERVIGSQAFIALPRLVHIVAKTTGGERLFVRAKSNLGQDGDGFTFDIEDREGIACARWGQFIEGDANALLAASQQDSPSRLEAAQEWLLSVLSPGPMGAKEIESKAEDAGHAHRTVDRAKKQLGVVASRTDGAWVWALPPQGRQECQGSRSGDVGALGALPARKRNGN